jgi:hypothetical protein
LQPMEYMVSESVRRVPSGAVMTAPRLMRPGFGIAQPSK